MKVVTSSEECDVITGLETSLLASLHSKCKQKFSNMYGVILHFYCTRGRKHIYFRKAYDPENRMVILLRQCEGFTKKHCAIFHIFFLSFGLKIIFNDTKPPNNLYFWKHLFKTNAMTPYLLKSDQYWPRNGRKTKLACT